MNIKNLQYFVHLCDSRSFSKTSSAMHISPSALSRQIQKLEDEIEQTLFLRDNRSVDVTPAGKKLLPVALQMIGEWNQFRSSISEESDSLAGELRLFCSVTASYSHLPDLLSDFRVQYPNIELKLSTGDPAQAIDKVLNDEADIAISAKPDQLPSRLMFETICDIPLSVIAPSGISSFASQLNRESPDWSKIPFIVPEAGTARDRANHWFKKMKLKPNVYAQVAGHEAIVSMVALGCGVGFAPDVVINNSPVRDKVERLKVMPLKPLQLGVCCQQAQISNPLIKALWDLV
ncbi:HTH-type transcriptional activator IlvY [Vibrio sp. S9_S30]|uniref:HTH-type transcriptional activator IlvY n=1 Tax=Vibrio sp. S9_S30 TaxID=2720226 RepID=UPI0016808371|nr:HTH-type transcriptional activator IlvY [Vibrio sp. S9_S30]MBD1558520.1 HTH-type transcriptional activator IlvY [Vibrio sp. S9_S30]